MTLLEWCATELGVEPHRIDLKTVAGDASFRRYFRVFGVTPTRIAVDAPPNKVRNREFTCISAMLRGCGVRAPEVYAFDAQRGYLLIEDMGDQILLPLLNADSAAGYYGQALDTLLRIQQSPLGSEGWLLADYSPALLRQEMALFPDWFVTRLLGISLTDEARELLDRSFTALVASAAEQPRVFVHRDYHSRNLMLLDDGELGIIDFQDAVHGPVCYDLVSLLRDCYIAWPAAMVHDLAMQYAERLHHNGTLDREALAHFPRWFDWMGLQRHIKVLGIFARLWLRDGKSDYLSDLPLVLRYTLDVSAAYPDLAEFNGWLRQHILPVACQQPWFRNVELPR